MSQILSKLATTQTLLVKQLVVGQDARFRNVTRN
jgi:hypothetical protein